jgi:peptidyl-lysine (3S)-dioxygenase / protease
LDPPHSAPIRISVKAGETLYLPVGWWHHVSQSTNYQDIPGGQGKGRCVALNWWYDTEMRGMSWVWLSFLRELGFKSGKEMDNDLKKSENCCSDDEN